MALIWVFSGIEGLSSVCVFFHYPGSGSWISSPKRQCCFSASMFVKALLLRRCACDGAVSRRSHREQNMLWQPFQGCNFTRANYYTWPLYNHKVIGKYQAKGDLVNGAHRLGTRFALRVTYGKEALTCQSQREIGKHKHKSENTSIRKKNTTACRKSQPQLRNHHHKRNKKAFIPTGEGGDLNKLPPTCLQHKADV